eukprot:12420569-Ditylum_brightwellii.AAC.1
MQTDIALIILFDSEFIELDSALAGHTIAMLICGEYPRTRIRTKNQSFHGPVLILIVKLPVILG